MMHEDDRVVITGAALVSSLGHTLSETWNSLLSGKSGIQPIQDFNAQSFKCNAAAQVEGLGPSSLNIHPRDARIMDKHSYMLLKCARDAFQQSHPNKSSFSPKDIGFFAGIGMVDYNVEDILPSVLKSLDSDKNFDFNAFYSGGFQEIYPLWPLSMLNNITFCQVAINLNIKGENAVFSPHADSGAQAIIEGMNVVLENRAKAVLAGGVSEKVSPSSLARAHLHGILNNTDKDEEMMCRPFGENRNGTILGEGCGILTLEKQSSALERDTTPLAVLSGYGFAFEVEEDHPCPAPSAISQAMRDAMDRAKIQPADIDLIIAHGDGTTRGDENEVNAIHQVFSDCIEKLNVYSSKGAIGHLFAGAPAVDIVLGIQMIKDGIIPSTLKSAPIEPVIKFNLNGESAVNLSPKRIMVNCQSYEGSCDSLIIEAVK